MNFDTFFGMFNQTPHQGNMAYAVALYAQAKLESGNFASQLSTGYNNNFGMKCAVQRQRFWDTSVTLGGETFATYASPMQSLLDRLDWDDYNGIVPPEEPEEVSAYMITVKGKGYATDPLYVNKWTSVVNGLSSELGGIDSLDYENEYEESTDYNGLLKYLPYVIIVIVVVFLWRKFRKR